MEQDQREIFLLWSSAYYWMDILPSGTCFWRLNLISYENIYPSYSTTLGFCSCYKYFNDKSNN